MKILDKILSPSDLKKLNTDELLMLCEEIREFLLRHISKTGGHLASNLGVVELTVALCRVFDFPRDKIIFDVGHQSYVYKLLTGRKDKFDTLRQLDGISGFPKVAESEYDAFDTGHSSNSISVALGMKRGYEKQNDRRKVIALVGDGSFGGGMIYEALNDIGHGRDNLMIILNDNKMSISRNISGISRYLNNIRTDNSYFSTKFQIENLFKNMPKLSKLLKVIKNSFKNLFINDAFFDELGVKYYGPFDGHNIEELINIFEKSKKLKGPFILHINTVKGKGYLPSEKRPDIFHGISKFDALSGVLPEKGRDFSAVFGEKIVKLAQSDEKIVAVTAAMPEGTGLSEFKAKFKDRFYDVGIAEQHAVSMCAGLAAAGMKPVFAVYSSFCQRCFDQLITDVALMKLHVVICLDRAGVVGQDGETHQGIFDISFLSEIPNLTVMSACDFKELEIMLDYAVNEMDSPAVIRYPRGKEKRSVCTDSEILAGRAVILKPGTDITIAAEGLMVNEALDAAEILEAEGISAEVINLRFIKPLDMEAVERSAEKTGRLVIMENGVKTGGIGQIISSRLKAQAKILIKAFDDKFLEHGLQQELLARYKLDGKSVAEEIKEVFDFEKQ